MSKNAIRYTWMINRQRFIHTAAATMLEAQVPQLNFWNECEMAFKYAQEKYLRATLFGQPTPAQIKSAQRRVYLAFKRDLKALVYDKMPNETYED